MRLVLCAGAAILCAACHGAPEPLRGAPAPRCYRLAIGPWKIPQDVQTDEQREVAPTPQLLILETVRTEGVLGVPAHESPWRLARGISEDPAWARFERGQPLRGWRVEGDSLYTEFSIPFGGLSMTFRMVGDSLLGKAEMWTDMGGLEYPSAPARGVRVRCPNS